MFDMNFFLSLSRKMESVCLSDAYLHIEQEVTSSQMQVDVGCEAPERWRSVDRAEHHTTAECWSKTTIGSERLWEEGSDEEETDEQIFWTLTGDEEIYINEPDDVTENKKQLSFSLMSITINNCDRKEKHEVFRSLKKVSHCENIPLQVKVLHWEVIGFVLSMRGFSFEVFSFNPDTHTHARAHAHTHTAALQPRPKVKRVHQLQCERRPAGGARDKRRESREDAGREGWSVVDWLINW